MIVTCAIFRGMIVTCCFAYQLNMVLKISGAVARLSTPWLRAWSRERLG